MEVKEVIVLHQENPIGIDRTPYFSWKLSSGKQNVMQAAYQIRVQDSSGQEIWDSGRAESSQDSYILYEGKELKDRKSVV